MLVAFRFRAARVLNSLGGPECRRSDVLTHTAECRHVGDSSGGQQAGLGPRPRDWGGSLAGTSPGQGSWGVQAESPWSGAAIRRGELKERSFA